MVIDASAIVAILTRQPDAILLCAKLDAATQPFFVSPLSVHDAVFGLAQAKSRAGPISIDLIAEAQAAVTEFLRALGVKDIILSADIGRRAIAAGRLYGMAVGHPAALDVGDCFAYACARAYRTPLLSARSGFALTDLA